MQMVINELSARFPGESVAEARDMMEMFVNTYFRMKDMIQNDVILLDQEYVSFLLAPNYRIEQWRNDAEVDIEVKRRFRSLIQHSAVYNSEDFQMEHEEMICSEFRHQERESRGCQLAYELEGVAVSFLSDDFWKSPVIEGIYRNIEDDGEIIEIEAEVRNVSCKENIDIFEQYYRQRSDIYNRKTFKSGNDILENKDALFPNLIFCDTALRQLRYDVGSSEVSQVYKKLMELQREAELLNGPFRAEYLTKATPESSITLQQFEEEHTFRLPDGRNQIFSWHIRFTGSYAGRIFFEPVSGQNQIYIGHIGQKLPTARYH